jgi:hypothetical protein
VEASQALQTGGSGSFAPLSCRLSFWGVCVTAGQKQRREFIASPSGT